MTGLTGTALEPPKGSVSKAMGAHSLSSVDPDELIVISTKLVDGGRCEDKGGVVRIDVLPYS